VFLYNFLSGSHCYDFVIFLNSKNG
jgi:hypothetical protein